MTDLKTLLSPFRPHGVAPKTAPPPGPKYVTIQDTRENEWYARHTYKTNSFEVDRIMTIASSSYGDGDWGSISIKTKPSAFTKGEFVSAFACLTCPEDVDALIEALELAKKAAFPPGGKRLLSMYD